MMYLIVNNLKLIIFIVNLNKYYDIVENIMFVFINWKKVKWDFSTLWDSNEYI